LIVSVRVDLQLSHSQFDPPINPPITREPLSRY
jgi:hypothetical protein